VTDTVELLDSLAKEGVAFWGEGSRLRFRASKGKLTDAMRSQLASCKDSVLADWRERATQSVVSHSASHGQRALWFLHESNPGSAAYNVVFSARVRSEIDVPALHRSFQALVDRHPSLRTSFREESDRLVQRVQGYMPVCFTVHDRPGIDLATLRKEVHRASLSPFDLQNGPLLRVDLYARAADDQIFHFPTSRWLVSSPLLDDLRQIYPAERWWRATSSSDARYSNIRDGRRRCWSWGQEHGFTGRKLAGVLTR
jgi:hypothetical protein